MRPSRGSLRFLGALALGSAAVCGACVDSNVTLGTAPDDPEVPHRAPTVEPRPRREAAAPRPTPTPPTGAPANSDAAVTPAPESAAAPPEAPAGSASTGATSELASALGDPVSVSAKPCESRGIHVRAVVPRPQDLDLSYRGAVHGIEIRRTIRSGAGTGGFRNAVVSSGTLEVDLWARGSGLVAGAVGYETCTGGAAADVQFDLIAHYRR
jgi:hypothetical protein